MRQLFAILPVCALAGVAGPRLPQPSDRLLATATPPAPLMARAG